MLGTSEYEVRWHAQDGVETMSRRFIGPTQDVLEEVRQFVELKVRAGTGGVEVWRRQVVDFKAFVWEQPQ